MRLDSAPWSRGGEAGGTPAPARLLLILGEARVARRFCFKAGPDAWRGRGGNQARLSQVNQAPWGPGSKPEHESREELAGSSTGARRRLDKQIPLSGAFRAEHLLSGRQASQERAGPIRREKTITRLQGGLKNGSGPCSGQVPCARAPCSEHSFRPLHPHAPGLFFPLTKRVELVLSAEQTRGVQFSPVRKWLLPPHLRPQDQGTTKPWDHEATCTDGSGSRVSGGESWPGRRSHCRKLLPLPAPSAQRTQVITNTARVCTLTKAKS